MRNTIRSFVAIELSSEVRTRAGQLVTQLAESGAHATWVAPQNMHLTLKFLGEVDTRDLPEICDALTESVTPFAPFEFQSRGAGGFPHADRARTVWLGVGRGQEQLVSLHEAIEKGFSKLGFRREQRRFQPHLTLGRVRSTEGGTQRLAELLQQSQEFEAGVTSVDAVVVFSSELERSGPVYEPICVAELAGK